MTLSLFLSTRPQTQAGEGKVYKCLFNHKFEEAMSEKVAQLKPCLQIDTNKSSMQINQQTPIVFLPFLVLSYLTDSWNTYNCISIILVSILVLCPFSTGGCGSVRVGRERYCSGVACHVSTADSTLMVGGI